MDKERVRFLEERVEYLLQEKTGTLKALESVLEVDDLSVSLNKLESSDIIVERAYKKISKLIKVKCAGFMLVDETSGFFTPAAFFPEECRDDLIAETDKLIMDNTFALAVKANRSITVKSKELKGYLLVHALSTVSRTRGMFVCQLDMSKEDVPDAVFSLITIVMNNTAHLLESFELYNRNRVANELLTKSVQRLEQSETHLKSFNEKLEEEVEARTKELKATNSLLENEISERKKIEKLLIQQKEALENLNETLENRVAIETENRRKSEQVLHEQSKMAAMGQMLSAISHQWRQPLNSLGLVIQDIQDEYDENGLSKEYLNESIDKAVKLLLHMSSTIDDFCNLVENDDDESSAFNVYDSVREVSELLSERYNNAGIFIETDCNLENRDESVLQLKGDSGIFKQILMNIFANSKDAISERQKNGKMSRGNITVNVRVEDDALVTDIVDNGGGIPAEVLDRVFEPYFTTKEDQKGTGIGLYMSKIFIEEHMQGSITAGNTGDGTVVKLVFPL